MRMELQGWPVRRCVKQLLDEVSIVSAEQASVEGHPPASFGAASAIAWKSKVGKILVDAEELVRELNEVEKPRCWDFHVECKHHYKLATDVLERILE